MSFTTSTEMSCCIENEREDQDMECCNTDRENCTMENCFCSIALSFSSFTVDFNEDLTYLSLEIQHNFIFLNHHLPTPDFPIWSPPDIA